jgi:hypothetical protein
LDVSKLVFWCVATCAVVGGAFLTGLYSGARENFAYEIVKAVYDTLRSSMQTFSDNVPALTGRRPVWHLQPARFDGTGVTVNRTSDGGKVLLSSFFEGSNELRLIERDGSIVARWPVSFSAILGGVEGVYATPATDWNTDIHGALALPDGSVVFNFEYLGLVKLDRCGKLVWKLEKPTHHSVEPSESGGFWVPSTRYVSEKEPSKYRPFTTPYYEDTILHVSDGGEVLQELSVVRMFYDNKLEALLTATGENITANRAWDREIVHLNKVGELGRALAADFPGFAAGDLLMSIRELNMVLVADPRTGRIKWWRIGPWHRQHDPQFKAGGQIVVFNNNAYRTAFGTDNPYAWIDPSTPRVSNIMEIDPQTGAYRVVYGGKPGQEMLSVIRGKVELRPGGGLLISEFEAGRTFETNADGSTVWEFINRYDDDEVVEITGARLYPSDYFDVPSWSCKQE